MIKEIWLISSVSTCDSWKTSKKDVLFAESTEEEASKTIEKFTKQVENETYIEGYEVRYIYEKINYYE